MKNDSNLYFLLILSFIMYPPAVKKKKKVPSNFTWCPLGGSRSDVRNAEMCTFSVAAAINEGLDMLGVSKRRSIIFAV